MPLTHVYLYLKKKVENDYVLQLLSYSALLQLDFLMEMKVTHHRQLRLYSFLGKTKKGVDFFTKIFHKVSMIISMICADDTH